MRHLNIAAKIGYQFLYIIKKGFETCFRHLGVNLLTVFVIAASMFLFSVSFLVVHNAKIILSGRDSPVVYSVFLKNQSYAPEVDTLLSKLRSFENIDRVQFIGKAEAQNLFLQDNPDLAGILEYLSENPFPDAIEIDVRPSLPLSDYVQLQQKLTQEPGVEEVVYSLEWLDKYSTFLQSVQIASTVFIFFIFCMVIFIVSNAIKITLYSKREEIEIMLMVGGTPTFVKLPYLLEGVLLGTSGSLLALATSYFAFRFVEGELLSPLFISFAKWNLYYLPFSAQIGLLGVGAFMGFLGSLLSLGQFVKLGKGI
jgi:cell division transport system permease protein